MTLQDIRQDSEVASSPVGLPFYICKDIVMPKTSSAPSDTRLVNTENLVFMRIEHYLTILIRSLCACLLLGIVFVISWQVVARYIPGLAIPRWTEEISLIMMVWLSLLGSGLAVRAGEHLAVDILLRQLPDRLQSILGRLVWLMVTGFGIYLLIYGAQLASKTMNQTFSATKLPVGTMYWALPFGGLLIAVYALRFVIKPFVPQDLTVAPKNNMIRVVLLVFAALTVIAIALTSGFAALVSPTGILLGSTALLLLLGLPIAITLGVACLLTVFNLGLPPLIVAQRMANGINSTPLLAIPFFILAGQIMATGGLAERLVNFARVVVGPIRGGLAMVNVVSSMLFGGASGSAVADVSANGSILIPMMKQKGYDTDFSVAVTVTSSTLGIIIPPSHNAVIYSLAAGGVSIGALFLGGYLPGFLVGVSLMIASYVLALRRGYPADARPSLVEGIRTSLVAIPSLAVGVIIVGGIAFGWFTATEAAAIGTVVAFVVATFIYRELGLMQLWQATLQAVRTISIVILLIATASSFAWLMAYLRIPTTLANGILSVSDNPIMLLAMINLLLLILGAIMDMAPLILILTPVLLPIVMADPINMSPVHFGIVLLMNLGLGLTTPPVGTALFVGCAIGDIPIERASRAMIYLWPAMLVVLILITYFPWFVSFIPRLLGAM